MTFRMVAAVVVDGVRGLARGRFLSFAAMAVIGITFSVAAVALLAAENLSAAVRAWGRPEVVRVYLDERATASEAAELAQRLRSDPLIALAEAVDPEEVRARFSETFPEMAELAALFATSPFPPEVEVVLAPGIDAAGRRQLTSRLEAESGVMAALTDDLWAGRLLDLSRAVRRAGQGAGLFFAVAAALVVAGVVRISLASRQDEIRVMTMVGAPRFFVAGPFVVEGLLLGAAGGLLAVTIAWAIFQVAGRLAPPLGSLLSLAFLPAGQAAMLIAAAGIAGALASAWVLMRRG